MDKFSKRKNRPKQRMIYDTTLAYKIGFTKTDLEANVNGYASRRQKQIYSFNSTHTNSNSPDEVYIPSFLKHLGELGCLIAVLIIFMRFLAASMMFIQRVIEEVYLHIRTIPVWSESGHVVKKTSENRYLLSINGIKFWLTDKWIYESFVEGEYYTIYYIPHSKVILSAMPKHDMKAD